MKKSFFLCFFFSISLLCCCVLYYANIEYQAGKLHFAPVMSMGSISPKIPQIHICFDGRDYYYYKENGQNGIYRLSSEGEQLIHRCSNVTAIILEKEGIVWKETDTKKGITYLNRLSDSGVDTIWEKNDCLLFENIMLPYSTGYMLFFQENFQAKNYQGNVFVDLNTGQWKHKYTFNIYPALQSLFFEQRDNQKLFLLWDKQTNTEKQIAISSDLSYCYCPPTAVYNADDIGYAVCIRNVEKSPTIVPPMNLHEGDYIVECSAENEAATPLVQTDAGERIIHLNGEIYCVFRWPQKTYSVYDLQTRECRATYQAKGIHAFGTYQCESAGTKLFIYTKNRLIDVIDLDSEDRGLRTGDGSPS